MTEAHRSAEERALEELCGAARTLALECKNTERYRTENCDFTFRRSVDRVLYLTKPYAERHLTTLLQQIGELV